MNMHTEFGEDREGNKDPPYHYMKPAEIPTGLLLTFYVKYVKDKMCPLFPSPSPFSLLSSLLSPTRSHEAPEIERCPPFSIDD
jgi:hypothetical protein